MKPWLCGDLTGVNPRKDLPQIRDTILGAVHRGEDLGPLYRALVAKDVVACAELVAGPKAIAHPLAVLAALQVVSGLEAVLAASGLYGRLLDLAPSAAQETLAVAARRHPVAPWLVGLSQRSDPFPGRVHLEAAAGTEFFAATCTLYAAAGVLEGLLAFTRERPSLEPLAALYRSGCLDAAVEVGAVLMEEDETLPVVGALAALHGPDLSFLGEKLLTCIHDPGIRERARVALCEA